MTSLTIVKLKTKDNEKILKANREKVTIYIYICVYIYKS